MLVLAIENVLYEVDRADVDNRRALHRLEPDGTVTDRIDVPLENPSMSAFGGEDRRTLFVTTIGDEQGRPATPGRDGVRPRALLAIEGTKATGIAETPFGF